MRLIYSNAAMVVAWLGPADTEATNSVKTILTTFSNLKSFGSYKEHFPDNDHLAEMNLPPRDSRGWNDLNLMLSVSYFSRVWIIQELAVSSKFQLLWGNITISEDEFESLTEKILFLSMTMTDPKGSPSIHWRPVPLNFVGKKKWGDQDLFQLVQLASGSKATIQQDKIYALVGLSGQHHYNVEPDYSKSESEVFADFATKVISEKQNLAILDYAYVEDPNEPKRSPLWAPRWKNEENAGCFVDGKYKASKDTKAIMKLSRDANVLELKGLEVGMVKDVRPNKRPESNGLPELHINVAVALNMVNNHKVPFEQRYKLDAIKVIILTMMAGRERYVRVLPTLKRPDDESYLDNFITYAATLMLAIMQAAIYDTALFALLQFALVARGLVTEPRPHRTYTIEDQSVLDRIRRKHPGNPEYVSTARDLMMLSRPAERMQRCSNFMKTVEISNPLNFFITGNGYVGIGPRCMKAGDKVCVLFGGSTPYVIRPTSITDEYLYLGPAYVHEIMDGEVIDAWEKDKDSDNQEFKEKFFKLL